MFRTGSFRPQPAALALGALLLAALAVPGPAAAQPGGPRQEGPERPFRGLFGAGPRDGSTGSSLSLVASVSGGYDDNIVSEQPNIDPRVSVGGQVYNGSAGLIYARGSERSSLGMQLNAAKRYFPANTDLDAASYSASIGYGRNLGRRTRLTVGQSIAYVPFYQFSLFPALGPPELGAPAPSNLDYAVSPLESWIVNSNVDLNRQLGRRSSLRLFYGYGFQDMGDSSVQDDLLLTPDQPANDLMTHTAGFQFNRTLTRHATARLGYSYRTGGYQYANADVTAHNIDVGIDYARSLSVSRRTTFSFSTGSSIVQIDDQRHFRVIGNANLNHQLTRTWTARLSYDRSVGYVANFGEPFFTDGLTASLAGFVGRRLTLSLTGAYVNGDVGFAAAPGSNVKTYSANFTAQYALLQYLAADFSAYSYKYDFEDPTFVAPGGLPGQFERQGVRAGLSLWLPLLR